MYKILFSLSLLFLTLPQSAVASDFNPLNQKEATSFYEGFNLALKALEAKELEIQGLEEEEVEFNQFMVVVDTTSYDDAIRFALQTIGFKYDKSVRLTFQNWIVISSFDRKANATTLAKKINRKYLAEQPANRKCFVYEKRNNQIFYKEKSLFYKIAKYFKEKYEKEKQIIYVEKKVPVKTQPFVNVANPSQNNTPANINHRTTLPLTHNNNIFQLNKKIIKYPEKINLEEKTNPNKLVLNSNTPNSNQKTKTDFLFEAKKLELQEQKLKQRELALKQKEKEMIQRMKIQLKKQLALKEKKANDIIAPITKEKQFNIDKPKLVMPENQEIFTIILKEPKTMPVTINGDIHPTDVGSDDLNYASEINEATQFISSKKLTTIDTQETYYFIDDLNVWVHKKDLFIVN